MRVLLVISLIAAMVTDSCLRAEKGDQMTKTPPLPPVIQSERHIPSVLPQPYVQKVLSTVCCREGKVFNIQTTSCEAPNTVISRMSGGKRIPKMLLSTFVVPRRGSIRCLPDSVYDHELDLCRPKFWLIRIYSFCQIDFKWKYSNIFSESTLGQFNQNISLECHCFLRLLKFYLCSLRTVYCPFADVWERTKVIFLIV